MIWFPGWQDLLERKGDNAVETPSSAKSTVLNNVAAFRRDVILDSHVNVNMPLVDAKVLMCLLSCSYHNFRELVGIICAD